VFGTADDRVSTFGVDAYAHFERFQGVEDTLNTIAFGLSTGKGTGRSSATLADDSISGSVATAISGRTEIDIGYLAGWGRIDPISRSDTRFLATGDEGDQDRIDNSTVLLREIGQGLDHGDGNGDGSIELIAAPSLFSQETLSAWSNNGPL